MDENKSKALAAALSQIEKQYGKGSIMRMDSAAIKDIQVVSTGSLGLDLALGVGGLPRGRVVEIYGPESSGKTTLVHLLSGALAPDTGRVHFDGADVTARKFHERVALGLARSYQITSVFRAFSALDNVALAVQARSGSRSGSLSTR